LRLLSSLKFAGIFGLFLMLWNCSEVNSDLLAPATADRSYTQDIKPIFDRSCIRCHGTEVQNGINVALNLSSYSSIQNFIGDSPSDEVVIVPGSATSRLLIKLSPNSDGMYKYLDDPFEYDLIYDWIVENGAAE